MFEYDILFLHGAKLKEYNSSQKGILERGNGNIAVIPKISEHIIGKELSGYRKYGRLEGEYWHDRTHWASWTNYPLLLAALCGTEISTPEKLKQVWSDLY